MPSSSSLTFRMEALKLRSGRFVGLGIRYHGQGGLRVPVRIVAQTQTRTDAGLTAPLTFTDSGMFVSVPPLATAAAV